MRSIKFRVSWPIGSGEEAKIDFQDCSHDGYLGLPLETILATFDLKVTLVLPTKFQISWAFGSGEEAKKNRFSRRPPLRTSWISDRNDFSYIWSTSYYYVSYQVSIYFALC